MDADGDGIGDVCDSCANDQDNDADVDGICGDIDNCPDDSNPEQTDSDGDGLGDVCDDEPDPEVVIPTPIPTLSEWGLIAMAGILGIVGFMVIRRKKSTA